MHITCLLTYNRWVIGTVKNNYLTSAGLAQKYNLHIVIDQECYVKLFDLITTCPAHSSEEKAASEYHIPLEMGTLKAGKKVKSCYTRAQLQRASNPLHFPYVFDATTIHNMPTGTDLPKFPAAALRYGMTVAIEVELLSYKCGKGGIMINLNKVAVLQKNTARPQRLAKRKIEDDESDEPPKEIKMTA